MAKDTDPLFSASPDDNPENTDAKPKRQRQKSTSTRKKKSDSFSVDDCSAKLFQLYTVLGKVLQTNPKTKRKESDFIEEAAALSRMSEKYPVVATILKFLDPVFFALGAYSKFSEHVTEFADRKKAEREMKKQAAAQNATYEMKVENGISNYPS